MTLIYPPLELTTEITTYSLIQLKGIAVFYRHTVVTGKDLSTDMRQTLCTLMVVLLTACSGEDPAAVVSPDAASTTLNDDSSIAALLTTEHDSVDGSSFWRCIISDAATTTTIGMRLNRDGTGFIAEEPVNWEVKNDTTAVFTLSAGYIEFNDIAFESLSDVPNNRFRATEPAGTQVVCDWNGPGRASQTSDFQNDPSASLALLLMSLNDSDSWQCSFPESPTSNGFELSLLPESSAEINSETASWFLNDRYDLILQSQNSTTVINQLYYPIGQSTADGNEFFSGSIRGETLNCTR